MFLVIVMGFTKDSNKLGISNSYSTHRELNLSIKAAASEFVMSYGPHDGTPTNLLYNRTVAKLY